jgi:nuclear GTP-binding protein
MLNKLKHVSFEVENYEEFDALPKLRIIYNCTVSGKIPYYTMPPVRDQAEPSEAKIVSEFSKEFNIDEVYNSETSFIGNLKSTVDLDPVEVPSSCPLNFDETMLEVYSLTILF